jgi:hypothetical protein
MKSAGDPRSARAVKLVRTSSRARRATVWSAMMRRCTASVIVTNFTSRRRTTSARPWARAASMTTAGTYR